MNSNKEPCSGLLPGTLSIQGKALPFYYPPPRPNHPTPHKATPTFPTLGQARKGLPKNGAREITSRSPHTAQVSSFLSPVKHRLLARSGGVGASPGGRDRQRRSWPLGSEYLEDANTPRALSPLLAPFSIRLGRSRGGALTASGRSPALSLSACILRSQVLRPPSQSWGRRLLLSFTFRTWATKKEAT